MKPERIFCLMEKKRKGTYRDRFIMSPWFLGKALVCFIQERDRSKLLGHELEKKNKNKDGKSLNPSPSFYHSRINGVSETAIWLDTESLNVSLNWYEPQGSSLKLACKSKSNTPGSI